MKTNLCPTSGAETTDPYLSLAGDTGQAGALASCSLCGARLRLEAAPRGRPVFPSHRPGETIASRLHEAPPEEVQVAAPAATPDEARARWARRKAEIVAIERDVYDLLARVVANPVGADSEIGRHLEEAGRHLISAGARAGVLARGGRP